MYKGDSLLQSGTLIVFHRKRRSILSDRLFFMFTTSVLNSSYSIIEYLLPAVNLFLTSPANNNVTLILPFPASAYALWA